MYNVKKRFPKDSNFRKVCPAKIFCSHRSGFSATVIRSMGHEHGRTDKGFCHHAGL